MKLTYFCFSLSIVAFLGLVLGIGGLYRALDSSQVHQDYSLNSR